MGRLGSRFRGDARGYVRASPDQVAGRLTEALGERGQRHASLNAGTMQGKVPATETSDTALSASSDTNTRRPVELTATSIGK